MPQYLKERVAAFDALINDKTSTWKVHGYPKINPYFTGPSGGQAHYNAKELHYSLEGGLRANAERTANEWHHPINLFNHEFRHLYGNNKFGNRSEPFAQQAEGPIPPNYLPYYEKLRKPKVEKSNRCEP
jgi:hypothetical protein